MFPSGDECSVAIENGTAVLMARIIDGGRSISRRDVAAIAYWIYERDYRQTRDRVVAGHNGVALDVDQVMLNRLQARGWNLDTVGYNFRHEIAFARNGVPAATGTQFGIRYEFTPTFGQKMIIRFQLGRLSR